MGYTTEFFGSFTFNKPVDEKLRTYVNNFSYVRHMRRDVDKIKEAYPNWQDMCYNGDLGYEGQYFTNVDDNWFGQTKDISIIDYNTPPNGVPGLWCKWIINKEGTELYWDGTEKFYNYVQWLYYLIDNFFAPNGYILDGHVDYQGESEEDRGVIGIDKNKISKYEVDDEFML